MLLSSLQVRSVDTKEKNKTEENRINICSIDREISHNEKRRIGLPLISRTREVESRNIYVIE